MPDLAVDSTPHGKQNLGQLSCFTASGLTSNDDDLMRRDGHCDVVANSRDGQIRIRNCWDERSSPLYSLPASAGDRTLSQDYGRARRGPGVDECPALPRLDGKTRAKEYPARGGNHLGMQGSMGDAERCARDRQRPTTDRPGRAVFGRALKTPAGGGCRASSADWTWTP